MEAYWDLIKRIIRESDLVLEILDARLIELSRNEEVERLVKEIGRPLIFVINKSDLASKKILRVQAETLRSEGYVVFVSAKSSKSIRVLLYMIKKVFKEYGKRERPSRKIGDPRLTHREAKADIVVGVLGYPNVGKSSIINALAHKPKAKVGKKAGTTHGIHWIKATNEIKLIDSPGVIPLKKDDDIRYGLIGARDSQQLHNPEVVADSLIKIFLDASRKKFELFYNIHITEEDFDSIVAQISQRKGYLLKGGVPDEHRTSVAIVRDWQQGKLRL